MCCHVINRGNEKRRIFFKDGDYDEFTRLLTFAKQRYPVKVFGFCTMPNHFHAIFRPDEDGALSAYLQWVLGTYALDVRTQTSTLGFGHVFQRRFWNDPLTSDEHFRIVLRYIEANPLVAKLVSRAEDWKWSSLAMRGADGNQLPGTLPNGNQLLDPLPPTLPANWSELVNSAQPPEEVDLVRNPIRRGRPPKSSKKDAGEATFSGAAASK